MNIDLPFSRATSGIATRNLGDGAGNHGRQWPTGRSCKEASQRRE